VLRDFSDRPYPIRIANGEGFERRSLRVLPAVENWFIGSIFREIEAGPAGHQDQSAFLADIGSVILELRSGGVGSRRGDHGHHRENQNFGGVAARRRGPPGEGGGQLGGPPLLGAPLYN